MKILNKSEQKEIYINLLKEQLATIRNMIKEAKVSLSAAEQKKTETMLLRVLNMANNYNLSFDKCGEEIKNILQSPRPVSKLQEYCQSFFASAHKYKDILQNTMTEGLKQRQEVNPHYPSCFDKSQTIYAGIDTSLSAFDVIEQRLEQINEVLPRENRLRYNETNNKLEDGKQSYSVGAFFSRRALGLKDINQKDEISSDPELFDVLQSQDSSELIELRKNRSLNDNHLNKKLIRLLADKVLFYQVSDLMQKQHTGDCTQKLQSALSGLEETYSRSEKMIEFAQQKSAISSDSLSVDTLVISINPHQIATQSEYKNWRNCTSADDFNHHRVIDGIAQGSIIVYGINSKLPQKKICRILLTPYQNENGNIVYHANKNYGEYNLGFKKAVENLAEEFSSKEQGIYNINPHILPDNAPQKLLKFASVEEFLKHQNQDFSRDKDGKIFIPSLNLAKFGLKTLPEFFSQIRTKDLNLSGNPLENLQNCPECENLDISHCSEFDKNIGKQIPVTVKTLNARFSNFNGLGFPENSALEEINISNNDAVDSAFLAQLPPKVSSVKANFTNLTSLKGMPSHVKHIEVRGCDIENEKDLLALMQNQNLTR